MLHLLFQWRYQRISYQGSIKLSKEEIESFVLIVEQEQVFTVNRVSQNTFGQPITANRDNELFQLKEYIFHQNPCFRVELGDQFIVTNEEKEIFAEGLYRVHLTLISLISGQEQNFTSQEISENLGIILKATEKTRSIVKRSRCTEWGRDFWDGFTQCMGLEEYQGLHKSYHVILQNGNEYHLDYDIDEYGLTEKQLLHLAEDFYLEKGDKILFGSPHFYARYEEGQWLPPDRNKGFFQNFKIQEKVFKGKLRAEGPPSFQTLNEYNKSNVDYRAKFSPFIGLIKTNIQLQDFGFLYIRRRTTWRQMDNKFCFD